MANLHKRSYASAENSHSLVIPEAGDWELRLARIALQIRQPSDLPTILQTTVDAVQQLLVCDRVLIYRFEPNGSSTVAVEAVSAPQWSLAERDTPAACFEACWLEPLQENQIAAFWAGLDVQANLVVPVHRKSQLWGVLIAHSCTAPHPWTDSAREGLQQIAEQVGLAIDQAELIAQLQATKADLEVQVTRHTQALAQSNQQLSAKVEECQAIATALGQVQDERFQLAAIVESSQDAIVSKTPDGIITSWNSAAEQLFGYTKPEAIGQSIYLLIPPDRQNEELFIFQRVHRGERVESYETQRLHKDGSVVDVALTISPIRDENGAVIGASKIARDIRDRKRSEQRQQETEQALQATQEQFRAFMNHAPILAWMVDRDGIVNYGNAEWLTFVGHTVQSALGRSIHDLVPPEFSQGYLHNNSQIIDSPVIDDLTQTGSVLETIEQGRALNGELHTYLVRKFPVTLTPQNVWVGGIAIDITDLKHAEDDLRRMNLVMENVVDGIARLDADGRYLSVNRAYAAICGYEPEDLIGQAWMVTVHPEDWPTLQAAYQTMQRLGKVEVEARGLRQDGSMFYKQVTMITNCDQQGQFIGHYCFLKDISDRKRTELALQENENTTRALIAAIPDFLVRMRQDGLQLQVINRGAIHVLGVGSARAVEGEADPVTNQWVTNIMPPAIAQERIALAQRALATQQIQSQEYEFVNQGQTYYEEARIVPIWKDEVLVVVRDITLRKRNEMELRNLSDRLTLALNAGEIGTWDWALGEDAHWDDRIYEIYGWSSQEQPVTYQNWQRCVEPEDLAQIEALLQQAIAGTAEFAIEFRIYRPNGEMRWVKTSALVQRDSEGRALRMIGINYDITARKQAELDLKSAKDQLELVLQASSEGFWDWNLVTGEIYFSPAWKAMLGYADHELDNSVETWANVIFADDRSSVLRLIEDYNSGQVDQFNITQRFHHKDGSTVYILSRAIHLKDDQGNVVRMVGSHLDMTHLVQMQTDLQTSEMLLSGILNSSLDGIMAFRAVRDPQGALIDFEWLLSNPASCTITGRQAEELIGKRLLEEFPGHRPSGLYDFYVEVVETGEPMQRQFYYNHDGINSWFENIAVPLGDGFAVTFRDITLVKESEIALQQINQQLKERISDLDQRHTEMLVLGEISDFLQACLTVEEACNTIANLVEPLFPHCAGGIFTTSPSRNRLENIATWGSSLHSPLHSTLEFQPQSCWGLRRGRMHWVGQNRSSLRCSHIPANEAIAATLCIPMIAQGETLGLFYLSTETANALSEAKQQLARTLAEQVGMAIANLNLRETLQHQSIRDPLTGLFNRRYLEESLTQEIVRAQRHRHPIGVIMIDIDHFKRFNDIFGHDVGDYVLQTVGALLKDSVRNSDIACRYGGEEMTLILPEASLEGTTARAEMIREAIGQLRISQSGKLLDAITASFGVACFPQHGSTSSSLIKAADIALYRAKDAGRNQVLVAL